MLTDLCLSFHLEGIALGEILRAHIYIHSYENIQNKQIKNAFHDTKPTVRNHNHFDPTRAWSVSGPILHHFFVHRFVFLSHYLNLWLITVLLWENTTGLNSIPVGLAFLESQSTRASTSTTTWPSTIGYNNVPSVAIHSQTTQLLHYFPINIKWGWNGLLMAHTWITQIR